MGGGGGGGSKAPRWAERSRCEIDVRDPINSGVKKPRLRCKGSVLVPTRSGSPRNLGCPVVSIVTNLCVTCALHVGQ